MAKVALVKVFTGLNLASAQLSGELIRAGHESKIIYFKDYLAKLYEEKDKFAITDYPGVFLASNRKKMVWNCYQPFNDMENNLLIKELKEYKPDLIGFSVVSGTIKETEYVTNLIRERGIDCPVIWGGPGPTLEPERCIEIADLLCIHEGEEVIVELADALDAGTSYDSIPGTWVRKPDGEIVNNGTRSTLNLDEIALPDWNLDHYVHINKRKGLRRGYYPNNLKDEYPIMTQRGCPFSCSFCIESRYQEMFGKKGSLRRRSVDLVLEELRQMRENMPNIKSVLFYDDVFTVNPRWLDEFLPRYKEEIGLPFWCYTYPTTHTAKMLKDLKEAGLISVTMGVQSGSERILREYFNRPTKRERVLEAAQEIVDLGPSVEGFFDLISGVHFETEEDLRATFDFLVELPIEFKMTGFGLMTNFPTYSYTKAVDNNPDVIAINEQLVTPKIYDYYHKLYWLTRVEPDRDYVRQVGNDPKYRENPELLDELMEVEPRISFTGIGF